MEDSTANEAPDAKIEASGDSGPSLWLALLLAAMAGGMGWGIRGQYGHETGAMVPGLLVGLVLVFLFCPRATSLNAARAVALTAVAFSFGGSMTYGQTVGLTHDAPLKGNWSALGWGMLGLFIKGGIWIGLAGAFLGMGLSGKKYRPLQMATLLFTMIALMFLGIFLLNQPFDPAKRELPAIYFSDDWRWEPDNEDLKPREERWGGLLFALAGLVGYVGWVRRDRLARNMALAGFLAGGFGFAIGQCVQAYRAWNPQIFQAEPLAGIDRYINWWNMMEITFGLILGFGLALGVWLNRGLVAANDVDDEAEMSPASEWLLVVVHATGLAVWNFAWFNVFDEVADHALTMGLIPLIAIAGGRCWPYMLSLPLLVLPIAGKTLRQLCYRTEQIPLVPGWIYFAVIPMIVMLAAAVYFMLRGRRGDNGRSFTRWTLILSTWFYFALNFAFFEFPWPWKAPTGRSPSAAIFLVCAVTLTVAALVYGWRRREMPAAGLREEDWNT